MTMTTLQKHHYHYRRQQQEQQRKLSRLLDNQIMFFLIVVVVVLQIFFCVVIQPNMNVLTSPSNNNNNNNNYHVSSSTTTNQFRFVVIPKMVFVTSYQLSSSLSSVSRGYRTIQPSFLHSRSSQLQNKHCPTPFRSSSNNNSMLRMVMSHDIHNSNIDTNESTVVDTTSNDDAISTTTTTTAAISVTDHDKDNNNDDATNKYRMKSGKLICVTGVVPQSGPLNEAVVKVLQNYNNNNNNNQGQSQKDNDDNTIHITLEDANQLIEIGAVWGRMESLTNQEIIDLYDDPDDPYGSTSTNSNSRALYADIGGNSNNNNGNNNNDDADMDDDLDEYINRMENQRYRRILSPSWIDAGTDIRIYPNPRYFTKVCESLSRTQHLLYEDTTFLVVDKPPMLPVQPDASNYIECCPGCVSNYMGPFYDINQQLVTNRPYICHRVDTCVGGCVVLSKTRNGQKVFQQYQRDRSIRKIYMAVTQNPVPIGVHIHWMWSQQSIRGVQGGPPCQLISLSPPESKRKAKQYWKRCVLEVTDCQPIEIIKSATAAAATGPPPLTSQSTTPTPIQYYQSTIRLVTGRKHQVRAQLASLNCPILHDTLYGPMAGLTLDLLHSDDNDVTTTTTTTTEDKMNHAFAQCSVPTQPIGLQAAGILFGGIKVKANPPWWSTTTATSTSTSSTSRTSISRIVDSKSTSSNNKGGIQKKKRTSSKKR